MSSSSEEEVLDSEDEAYKRGISIQQLRAERFQSTGQGKESTATQRPTRNVRFADMDWDPTPPRRAVRSIIDCIINSYEPKAG
jgi:hypothetical protein